MIHHQRTHVINAKPEAVWAVLSRYMHIDEFAPQVTKVEALTAEQGGIGAKRRCHFKDGNSMAEVVTAWDEGRRYRVRLSETQPMPLKEGEAEIAIRPEGAGQTHVTWSMDYRVKYGPIGWLMGQTLMKMMISKILDANLKGLAERAATQ
ncbi:MAG: SRPBCC family protein [Pseudomonadota bacterium]